MKKKDLDIKEEVMTPIRRVGVDQRRLIALINSHNNQKYTSMGHNKTNNLSHMARDFVLHHRSRTHQRDNPVMEHNLSNPEADKLSRSLEKLGDLALAVQYCTFESYSMPYRDTSHGDSRHRILDELIVCPNYEARRQKLLSELADAEAAVHELISGFDLSQLELPTSKS